MCRLMVASFVACAVAVAGLATGAGAKPAATTTSWRFRVSSCTVEALESAGFDDTRPAASTSNTSLVFDVFFDHAQLGQSERLLDKHGCSVSERAQGRPA